MLQEILTGITVSGAFVYTFYSVWKTFFSNNGRACGGGSPSCSAKKYKPRISRIMRILKTA